MASQDNRPAATRLDWHTTGVAVLTLDQPDRSANLLSSAMLDQIERRLDEVDARGEARGLVFVSAKPGVFIAGADLTEFAAGLDRPEEEILATSRRGQTLFARLAESDYPTLAAIDGVCVGGGLELAVWCDCRIVTDSPKTQLGFPEVKLGLFPGWGGTARTPRMIGLANAIELVTGGENISGRDAYKLGLADDLVPSSSASDAVLDAALRRLEAEHASGQWLRDRERWAKPIHQSETELSFLGATASALIQQKTKGHYPAPMAALELMLEASQFDLTAACLAEAEAFVPLFGSSVNRSLLNVFFLTDRAKKQGGDTKNSPAIESATVVGAGIMGQGIAAANLKRSISVRLADNREEAIASGMAGVVREASYNKQTRATDAKLAIERSVLITPATTPEQMAGVDVVIEAIIEREEIKRELFASIEPHGTPRTILCSNTSTIPITRLAAGLKHPDRFCGLHFFNPVRKMPLVEVIRGELTSDATVATMVQYARHLGKTPIVVGDGPGFLVNRLLMPYMNEAALMAGEGMAFDVIDRTAKQFGMPMGPLALHDVVGLDTCLHAGKVLHTEMGDRIEPAPIVAKLVEADRQGQKNSRGFYDYLPAKPGRPSKGVPSDEAATIAQQVGATPPADEVDTLDRLLMPMLVEATRAIEEGIVADVRDVDLALVLGIGFPPHQGGLFHWADTLGADTLLKRLEPLASLGKRFEPTAMLLDAAKQGKRFYD